MKHLTSLIVLGLVALTPQAPAYATASATVSVSEYTCSHFAADGALISTSTQVASFSETNVGVPGRFTNPGSLDFGTVNCHTVLSLGEELSLSANVALSVSDEGLSGTLGGEIPLLPFGNAVRQVPAGFEFASASATVDYFAPFGVTAYELVHQTVLTKTTNLDALADNLSLSGVIQGTIRHVVGSVNTVVQPEPTIAVMTVAAAVSGVPEPQSYGMLLAGLGLLGFAAARRRNHNGQATSQPRRDSRRSAQGATRSYGEGRESESP